MNTVRTIHASIEPDRIDSAQRARRCTHIKLNGEACGCPALRDQEFCRFHIETEANKLSAPFIGDAAALQVAIMRIYRALEVDMIDLRRATAMLYALQLASSNLTRLGDELPVLPAEDGKGLERRIMRLIAPPPERYINVLQKVEEALRCL